MNCCGDVTLSAIGAVATRDLKGVATADEDYWLVIAQYFEAYAAVNFWRLGTNGCSKRLLYDCDYGGGGVYALVKKCG